MILSSIFSLTTVINLMWLYICTYVHMHLCSCIHTYVPECWPSYLPIYYIHTCMCMYIRTYVTIYFTFIEIRFNSKLLFVDEAAGNLVGQLVLSDTLSINDTFQLICNDINATGMVNYIHCIILYIYTVRIYVHTYVRTYIHVTCAIILYVCTCTVRILKFVGKIFVV